MKIMKKAIAVLTVFALLFSLFSCADKPSDKPSESETESQTGPEESTEETQMESNNPMFSLDEKFHPVANIEAHVELDRYADNIMKFADKGIEEGMILFYGSSTFTRWSEKWGTTPLEEVFTDSEGKQVCVNCGFGGSNVHELCYWYNDVVLKYKPRVLVITTFANASGYSADDQLKCAAWLLKQCKKDFPDMHIYITDCRPMLKYTSREKAEEKRYISDCLQEFCATLDNVKVITLSEEPMFYLLEDDAKNRTYFSIRPEIYVEDQVHLTPEGYAELADVFMKYIGDELK